MSEELNPIFKAEYQKIIDRVDAIVKAVEPHGQYERFNDYAFQSDFRDLKREVKGL